LDVLEYSASSFKRREIILRNIDGALDALRAASVGKLQSVTCIGRKPPQAWKGSPAESRLDLDILRAASIHFEGSARDAAIEYPKNANVAAMSVISNPEQQTLNIRF